MGWIKDHRGFLVLVLCAVMCIGFGLACGVESRTDVSTDTAAAAAAEADVTADGGDASIGDTTITAAPVVNVPAQTNFNDVLISLSTNLYIWITAWAILIAKALPNDSTTFGFKAKKG